MSSRVYGVIIIQGLRWPCTPTDTLHLLGSAKRRAVTKCLDPRVTSLSLSVEKATAGCLFWSSIKNARSDVMMGPVEWERQNF